MHTEEPEFKAKVFKPYGSQDLYHWLFQVGYLKALMPITFSPPGLNRK